MHKIKLLLKHSDLGCVFFLSIATIGCGGTACPCVFHYPLTTEKIDTRLTVWVLFGC